MSLTMVAKTMDRSSSGAKVTFRGGTLPTANTTNKANADDEIETRHPQKSESTQPTNLLVRHRAGRRNVTSVEHRCRVGTVNLEVKVWSSGWKLATPNDPFCAFFSNLDGRAQRQPDRRRRVADERAVLYKNGLVPAVCSNGILHRLARDKIQGKIESNVVNAATHLCSSSLATQPHNANGRWRSAGAANRQPGRIKVKLGLARCSSNKIRPRYSRRLAS